MNTRREAILWSIAIAAAIALGLAIVWTAIALAFSRPNLAPLYFASAPYRQDDYSVDSADVARISPLEPALEQEAILEDQVRGDPLFNAGYYLKIAERTPRRAIPVAQTSTARTVPTATPQARATKQPTATPQPTDTRQPTITPQPTDTRQPTTTLQPTTTRQPTITPQSTASRQPTATFQPTATPQPKTQPKTTSQPTATQQPMPTKQPKPTKQPRATKRPKSTKQPQTTPEPTVMQLPGVPFGLYDTGHTLVLRQTLLSCKPIFCEASRHEVQPLLRSILPGFHRRTLFQRCPCTSLPI